MRLLACLALVFLLGACASLSEDQCRAGNWSEIGERDGANGRDATFVTVHEAACAEYAIAPDRAAWEEGRREGLAYYCRPARAWREGAEGRRLKDVCPFEDRPTLEAENRRGLTYHRIGRDIDEATRRIGRINSALLHPSLDPADRSALASERAFLRLEILTLRTERQLYRL